MKIGIFAGTFDPVHNGHLAFARSAIDEAGLEKVIIIAEKEPYRKKPHASWDHRQAMIERATEKIQNVDHDYAFAAELAHQHTMKNMLEVAEKHYGPENKYWFLVGSDLFEHMHQWHDLVAEQHYGGFVVALREGHTPEWLAQKQQELTDIGAPSQCIVIPNSTPHASSSRIRAAISKGETTSDTPHSVIDYITRHNLYS